MQRDRTSDEYHSHITSIARMTSVLTDVPKYPSFYKLFNKKPIQKEESNSFPKDQQEQKQKQKRPETETRKKVQFVETKDGRGSDEEAEESEKSIDSLADGFLKQKRKNFELCKWKTFK